MSAVRNFIITLILSLLIFGLIAYGIVQFALGAFGLDGKGDESQGTDSITVEPDGSVTDSHDDPKTWDDVKGDSFTVLLIGTDHQPSVYKDYGKSEGTDENGFPKDPRTVGADTMILVRVNKETGECVICAIPTNTKITADGMQCRLSELYAMKGAEAVKRRVMALTGLPVDYYAAISVENFAKLINGLGGVTFFVANDISYVDNTGKTVNLRRGSQKLNGEKAVSMLKYRGYGDGDNTRRSCAAKFIKELAKAVLVQSNYSDANVLYAKYKDYFDTDFTLDVLGKNIDLIFSYSKMNVIEYTYPGTTIGTGEDEYFSPGILKATEYFSKYKFNG